MSSVGILRAFKSLISDLYSSSNFLSCKARRCCWSNNSCNLSISTPLFTNSFCKKTTSAVGGSLSAVGGSLSAVGACVGGSLSAVGACVGGLSK